MNAPTSAIVLVGVTLGVPDEVIVKAAEFAHLAGAELVCAFVDVSSTPVETYPDGSVRATSTNPDVVSVSSDFPENLREQLVRVLQPLPIHWSTRYLAGGPAVALSALAEHLDAVMIVVGTRESAMKDRLREFVNGSVAIQLAHRQHRPVMMIPRIPIPLGTPLSWESE